ncbi:alpha/beta hydrolase [Croceiramulus getboli]|nr:alpha/beta fold hydrolase [Flavobacteriaceae bacterium YJPT1-3]
MIPTLTTLSWKNTRNTFLLLLSMWCAVTFAQESTSVATELQINPLIRGTLLSPKQGSNQLAILIAGSGPTDRNGNQRMAQNNALKLLAEALAQQGIASFRYDKRIFTLLQQGNLKEEDLRFEDFVEDAVAVVEHFNRDENYTDLILIGHSQGSLVALLAAQKAEVDKLVSLAGAGKSIDKVIVDQIGSQMPELRPQAEVAMNTLAEQGKVADYSPALQSILRPAVQPFIYSWLQYDPAQIIAELDLPLLIINGTKDLQVAVEEAERLKEAAPMAQLKVLENMNHVLKDIPGKSLENAKSYNEPHRPLAPELVQTIVDFIKA